jgi:hypothetical protein
MTNIPELVAKAHSYSGVGSRETPKDIFSLMELLAAKLAENGVTLRSGGADGADTAFENGAKTHPKTPMEIYLPWKGFNKRSCPMVPIPPAAFSLARKIHPAWDRCSQAAQKLHARNTMQVLGANLDSPAAFVLFWASEQAGKVQGGTATAVHLARQHGIPTYNLKDGGIRKLWTDWLHS